MGCCESREEKELKQSKKLRSDPVASATKDDVYTPEKRQINMHGIPGTGGPVYSISSKDHTPENVNLQYQLESQIKKQIFKDEENPIHVEDTYQDTMFEMSREVSSLQEPIFNKSQTQVMHIKLHGDTSQSPQFQQRGNADRLDVVQENANEQLEQKSFTPQQLKEVLDDQQDQYIEFQEAGKSPEQLKVEKVTIEIPKSPAEKELEQKLMIPIEEKIEFKEEKIEFKEEAKIEIPKDEAATLPQTGETSPEKPEQIKKETIIQIQESPITDTQIIIEKYPEAQKMEEVIIEEKPKSPQIIEKIIVEEQIQVQEQIIEEKIEEIVQNPISEGEKIQEVIIQEKSPQVIGENLEPKLVQEQIIEENENLMQIPEQEKVQEVKEEILPTLEEQSIHTEHSHGMEYQVMEQFEEPIIDAIKKEYKGTVNVQGEEKDLFIRLAIEKTTELVIGEWLTEPKGQISGRRHKLNFDFLINHHDFSEKMSGKFVNHDFTELKGVIYNEGMGYRKKDGNKFTLKEITI